MNIDRLLNNIDISKYTNSLNNIITMNHSFPIFVYLLIALMLTKIPYLNVYFSLWNRLLNEIIRSIIKGGIASKIYLNNNSLRQPSNLEHSRFKNTLITYAGYTCESLAAIGLFYLVSTQHYQFILYLFIGLVGVSVLLWIRNIWGIIWALSFAVLLALPIYFRFSTVIMHISILLSSFILVRSIMNGFTICRQSLLERKNPTGYRFVAILKLIPPFMFGLVLVGQSLWIGYFILKNFYILH